MSFVELKNLDRSKLNNILSDLSKEWDFWSSSEVAETLSKGNSSGFISFSEPLNSSDNVTSFSMFSISFENADLLYIYTPASYRGNGHGKKLLEYSFQKLYMSGVEKIFLEVRKSNGPAISLYEKLGFELSGEREKYYKDGETAKIMTLDLNGYVLGTKNR